MRDWMRRTVRARLEVAVELMRRGMFSAEQKPHVLRYRPEIARELHRPALGSVQFATLLAQGDSQLAARAVLRNVLNPDELSWLDRLLKLQKSNGKRDELARIVERALEGRKGNASKLP